MLLERKRDGKENEAEEENECVAVKAVVPVDAVVVIEDEVVGWKKARRGKAKDGTERNMKGKVVYRYIQ
ncbi:hypothetical protein MGYG_08920 [Nannizzia gypsea CBS 118893]|uniref:Uncharacterized protein n=1 Tax=Arthroderma gypseum (strain ATCC MYA-4604 / CBS 118893) TaxID=535722 RepID=E5QZB3_ARTGP|nr:hypothetical protein MGYG_08920 [Nannizzia gypsea CBS 118893]EFQ98131.1 hypothetical protein MGYG_08920 [Nannizzia gypsea CBS 118893]